MTKIDIKESEGGGARSSSSSPARREAGVPPFKEASQTAPEAAVEENKSSAQWDSSSQSRLTGQTVPLCSDKNREGVSNESGYFEDEEEAGEVRENSIEIIFDKNASNNNSGNKATEGGKTGKICVL